MHNECAALGQCIVSLAEQHSLCVEIPVVQDTAENDDVRRWQRHHEEVASVEFQPVSDHSFQVIRSGFPRIKLEVWRTGDSEIIEFLFTVTRSWYAEPTQDRDQFWISVDRGENLTLTDGDKTLDLQAATERLVRPLLRPGTT